MPDSLLICLAHCDELGSDLRLADVRGQPQKEDHAWIAPRGELAEPAQAVHGQVEIARLTMKTFRLVAVSRKASIRKRTREAPQILPFRRGHPGLLLRCRAM